MQPIKDLLALRRILLRLKEEPLLTQIRRKQVQYLESTAHEMLSQAAEIRYRIDNPQGFLADQLINDAERLLTSAQERIQRGKRPYNYQIKTLKHLTRALLTISQDKTGRRWKEAADILFYISLLDLTFTKGETK